MSDSTGNPRQELATPVQYLKGVGPQRAELLERLGLRTARDLLFFFPRDYQDMTQIQSIRDFAENQPATVSGTVEEIDLRGTGTGKSLLGVLVRQGDQFLRAVWFNQSFMREKFYVGQQVVLMGSPKMNGLRWEMSHPKVELPGDTQSVAGRVLPVYSLTEGVKQSQMRRAVRGVVERFAEVIDDVLPADFLKAHDLMPIAEALAQVHAPADLDQLGRARRRFIFQELLVLQLAVALRRSHALQGRQAAPLAATTRINARIERLFPFPWTEDQRQCIDEVAADMARETPMNRLLQGDVGAGKTVVAIYAMLLAVAHGKQAALMAPTEVLARQHARTLADRLAASQVRIGLLTGSLSAAERRDVLERISQGEVDLIVGTQAIVQSGVEFADLGLVVIDEQHKFGVRQRAMLKQSGPDPHYLVMTATPIPRTVSMTVFGDLDVSTLRRGPPGRQTIHSYLADDAQRERWWKFFGKKLREGRQGYVVAPLVDESSSTQLASVEQLFESLANGPLEEFRLNLVHGRLNADEKDRVMRSFAAGDTQVLVATSVVEVGIDVPNATVMTIEDGERFGLAQLHQLRGRISRGTHPGFVCVFAEPHDDASRERLEAFTKTTDGFELAELDFRLRGPGDLFGTRQHGLPPFRMADLIRDADVLAEARAVAQRLIQDDADLADPRFALLRRMVEVRYGKVLELSDVG